MITSAEARAEHLERKLKAAEGRLRAEGVCMSCWYEQREPCTDCLNTGYERGQRLSWEVVEIIEQTIPADWDWLVRRNPNHALGDVGEDPYFANICEPGPAVMIYRPQPDGATHIEDPARAKQRFPAYGPTPEAALQESLAAYNSSKEAQQ